MTNAELRLGNYIRFNEYFDGELCEPNEKAIDEDDMHEMWSGSGLPDKEPIPLTEEWLLKFGFERLDTSWIRRDNPGFRIHNPSKTNVFILFNFMDVTIDYIHQLQNLYFALTGEELKL
jgi:hypothetical protein